VSLDLSALPPFRVTARNLVRASENKMHDDTVARRLGFAGGLVAGVDVFAYMCHLPLQAWGRDFLARGQMSGRFLKPLYDGDAVEVTAEPLHGDLVLRLTARGEVCATGKASLPAQAPRIDLGDFVAVPPAAERSPIGDHSFPEGSWVGIVPMQPGPAANAEYLAAIGEAGSLCDREGLLHPGTLLRSMNQALMDNARLGPWIHVASTLSACAVAPAGAALTVRARVAAHYDRKGHRFVELDGVIVADGSLPVAHCRHVAIVQPRQAVAAA
jgi:acyl dehydratase